MRYCFVVSKFFLNLIQELIFEDLKKPDYYRLLLTDLRVFFFISCE